MAELGLPRSAAVPSRETLRRFGNTSPASTFYILAHLESHVRAASQRTPSRPGICFLDSTSWRTWRGMCALPASTLQSGLGQHEPWLQRAGMKHE